MATQEKRIIEQNQRMLRDFSGSLQFQTGLHTADTSHSSKLFSKSSEMVYGNNFSGTEHMTFNPAIGEKLVSASSSVPARKGGGFFGKLSAMHLILIFSLAALIMVSIYLAVQHPEVM